MFSDVIGAFVLSRLGISINELLGISEGRLIYNTTSKIIHLFLLVIIILFTIVNKGSVLGKQNKYAWQIAEHEWYGMQ